MSSAAQLNIAKSSSQLRRDARTLQAFMALKAQEIGERISALRDAKGNPPQPRVAAAVGVSLRTYQAWEAGEARPQYHNLEALAEYYDTTEEYILTGAQPKPPPVDFEGRIAEIGADTPDLFARQPVDAALTEVLQAITNQLVAQTEVLNEIRVALGEVKDLLGKDTETANRIDEATRRVDASTRTLAESVQAAGSTLRSGTPRRKPKAPKRAPKRSPKASGQDPA